jgi:hypothetical protein
MSLSPAMNNASVLFAVTMEGSQSSAQHYSSDEEEV